MAKEDIDFLKTMKDNPQHQDWMEKSLKDIHQSFEDLNVSCREFIKVETGQ